LEDFYTLTKLRATFISHDLKEAVRVPENLYPFCELLRKDTKAYKRCMACDKMAFEHAYKSKRLYIYECHAGLTELVVPICHEDKILGYLMLGQTLYYPASETKWNDIYGKCKDFTIGREALREAFFQLPYLDIEGIYAAARLLEMSSKYIHFSKLVKIQNYSTIEKVINYIEANLEKPVTISILCDELNMSKSHLSRLIKAELGCPLTEYVLHIKIEKSKFILETTDLKVSHIASSLGFVDQNYFSRLFKKSTGLSPTEYRTKLKEKA
jgi:AraC-like DNA-binding protein